MNDYCEVRINLRPCCEDATDLLAALLGDCGYESFVPDSDGLTAYVKADQYSEQAVIDALADFPFPCKCDYTCTFVEGQDWNAEWEKNYFKPIVVEAADGNSVVIHSTFHTDVPAAKYDIVIDPKMAFGTGHHATTSLIIAQLLSMDLSGKSVIDMGTGTGILAILAAMRGATQVTGIEIDPFAYENAVENERLNSQPQIRFILGDASALADVQPADVLIANINRNIIVADLAAYAKALKPDGVMLLSGFYEQDIPVVLAEAQKYGLREVSHTVKGDNWTCVRLSH